MVCGNAPSLRTAQRTPCHPPKLKGQVLQQVLQKLGMLLIRSFLDRAAAKGGRYEQR